MKLLKPNKGFYEEVTNYQPPDSLLAIGLFIIISSLYGMLAFLENKYFAVKENLILAGCGVNIVIILITFLFITIRKGKLSSIGLYNGKWKQSCIIGLILASILFFSNCLLHIINGENFIETKGISRLIIYYLTVALCEEVVFRGYIGTRLYGLMKNQYLVIIINGILFIVMHFPYRMIAYGKTIGDLTIHSTGWIFDLFVTHVILSFIYLKTNSLYGSIIPHWVSNLAYNLVAR